MKTEIETLVVEGRIKKPFLELGVDLEERTERIKDLVNEYLNIEDEKTKKRFLLKLTLEDYLRFQAEYVNQACENLTIYFQLGMMWERFNERGFSIMNLLRLS